VVVVGATVVVVVVGAPVVVVIATVLVVAGVVVPVRMFRTWSASRERKEQTRNRTSRGAVRRALSHLFCA
jgi:hypothetical protein